MKATEAETTYKSCVIDANHRQAELEKAKVRYSNCPNVIRISVGHVNCLYLSVDNAGLSLSSVN